MAKDRYVPSFPKGKDAAQDFYKKAREWAKEHGKASTISSYDKSSSTYSYILSYYGTWGEVLDAARENALKRGVSEKEIKAIDTKVLAPKAEKVERSKGLDSGDLKGQVYKAKTRLNILTTELNRYEPKSKEYEALLKQYNDQAILVADLTTQYESALTEEKELDKYSTAKENIKSLDAQLTALKQARTQTADLGYDTKALDDKIAKVKTQLGTERATVKNFTPKTQVDIAAENKAKAEAKTKGQPYVAPEKGVLPPAKTQGTPTTPGTPSKPGTPSTPSTPGKPTKGTSSDKPLTSKEQAALDKKEREEALDIFDTDYSLPETLFNNIDELKELLQDYVNSDKQGGQWTISTLRQKLRNTNWYKNNSQEIKNRYVQLYNYRDQLKGGQDVENTDYAKQIRDLESQVLDKARKMGSGLASEPDKIRQIAENMYITNASINDAVTTGLIAAAIRPITSTLGGKVTEGYSGEALTNYQNLQSIAKANGFKISDIVPGAKTEQQVLQGIATGALDVYRIAQDARRIAAQGQPQYVRDLLGQGYNLDDIFKPYKQTMAGVLEIDDPDSIDLNDPTLRAAISDKGDMNVYDFKKLLKQDNRWQYTENARQEVSNAAMKVLRDFGFQG